MRLKSLLLIANLPTALLLASQQLAFCQPGIEQPNDPATDFEQRRTFAPPDTFIRNDPSMLSALEATSEKRYWIDCKTPRDKSYKGLTTDGERANLAEEFQREYSEAKSEGKLNEFIANELSWMESFWQSRCSGFRDLKFQNYKPQTKSQKKHLQNFLLTSLIDNLELQCRLVDEVTKYPRGKYKFQSQRREAEYLKLRAHQKAIIELKKMNEYEGPLEDAKIREALAAVATK